MLKKIFYTCLLFVHMLYAGTLAFTLENDFFGTKDEDSHYTDGIFLTYMSDANATDFLDTFFPEEQSNLAVSFTHQMFTPVNGEITTPQWDDLPYAGYARFNFLLYKSTDNYFHEFGINFGAVGPVTHAEQLQTFFHHIWGNDPFKGWDTQLGNQVTAGVSYQFAYKTDPYDLLYGYKWDAIGNVRGELGNFYTGALTSVTLRLSSVVQKSFMTAGSFTVGDESYLLNEGGSEGFNWDISFGVFASAIHNYYIVDEGIDEGYHLKPMHGSTGWQGAFHLMYGSFIYAYTIKSTHVNGQRHKRWGGMTLGWRF
ncbi:lipid A deacylase LpxR family protein [Sulfurovum sp.]|uniref:lipid A deacylase LpxR family protein n=1 Tax=Sulfurovum sp. TaxID=1969726 RepID=UPI0025F58F04|nr:lipid A deacylase LpxR family protein [Sulfurovum sp.]